MISVLCVGVDRSLFFICISILQSYPAISNGRVGLFYVVEESDSIPIIQVIHAVFDNYYMLGMFQSDIIKDLHLQRCSIGFVSPNPGLQ